MHQEFFWVRLKLSITCFSMWTNYFITESIDAFSFVDNVVIYKALLVKEKSGKVVYKIFIINIVSMHLSATWQFWPFQRAWTRISWGGRRGGFWIELQWGGGEWRVGGLAHMGEKAQRWEVQKCEGTMLDVFLIFITKKTNADRILSFFQFCKCFFLWLEILCL